MIGRRGWDLRRAVRVIALFMFLLQASHGSIAETASPYSAYQLDARGRLLVTAELDQHRLIFRLDSAASHSVLYQSAAWLLDLEIIPLASKRVQTATGARDFPLFRAEILSALGKRLTLGRIVALADPPDRSAVGLIGTDFLRGSVIHVRQTPQEIALLASSQTLAEDGLVSIEGMQVGRGALAVHVRIAGLDIPVIIDTGASHSVLNRPALTQLNRLSPDSVHLREPGRQRLVQASGGRAYGDAIRLDTLELGPHRFQALDMIAADLPVFRPLGAAQAPAMILGMDILGQMEFALDLSRYRLWLSAAADPQ